MPGEEDARRWRRSVHRDPRRTTGPGSPTPALRARPRHAPCAACGHALAAAPGLGVDGTAALVAQRRGVAAVAGVDPDRGTGADADVVEAVAVAVAVTVAQRPAAEVDAVAAGRSAEVRSALSALRPSDPSRRARKTEADDREHSGDNRPGRQAGVPAPRGGPPARLAPYARSPTRRSRRGDGGLGQQTAADRGQLAAPGTQARHRLGASGSRRTAVEDPPGPHEDLVPPAGRGQADPPLDMLPAYHDTARTVPVDGVLPPEETRQLRCGLSQLPTHSRYAPHCLP